MYNEDLKEAFIFSYTKSISRREVCVYIFNLFEPYEREWGADLCTRPVEDLQPIANELIGLRTIGNRSRLAALRQYGMWCLENNVPGACDGVLKIVPTNLEKVRTQTVINPLHLQKYLDALFTKESEETVDCTYRCFYWMAYGGCPEDLLLSVTTDGVDFSRMVFKAGDEEFPIYREGLEAFRKCAELKFFVYIHPNYSNNILRQRLPGNILLRGVRSEPTLKSLRVKLSGCSKIAISEGKTDLQLSYYRVWLSGVFYRMYQLELIGQEPDFKDVAADFMKGKVYKLEKSRNLPGAKQRSLAKAYLEDYETWKMTFLH